MLLFKKKLYQDSQEYLVIFFKNFGLYLMVESIKKISEVLLVEPNPLM